MKVLKLSLANYRGFEQIDISFEPDVTVIAGVNGVGKSGVMDALLTLLSHTQQLHGWVKKGNSYEPQDIRIGQNNLSTEATFDLGISTYKTTVYRGYSGTDAEKKAEANLNKVNIELRNKELSQETKKKLKERKRFLMDALSINRTSAYGLALPYSVKGRSSTSDLPLGIFFSPERNQFINIYRQKKEALLGTSSAFESALERRPVKLTPFLDWYRQRLKLDDPSGSRRQVLPVMLNAVEQFLPGFSNLRLEEKPRPRFTIEKDGKRLDLHQLSDGEKSVLAMVLDMSRRLSLAYPTLEDPLSEGEAIVLVDEIELHLHPDWQRKIIQRFKDTFPNCQFIFTTHSPQIVGEVSPKSVRLIKDGLVSQPAQSYGMDSNWILEHLMDVDKRNSEIDSKFDLIQELIAEKKLDEATIAINAVRSMTGPQESLQRLAATVSRIKLMGK